ncbi:hypothetical protein [Sphingomonas sp.]|uniref:hypothetical protein n=1 Tax=Sphingomonas sp. TaxID=28214 RepID=UPI003CC5434B
MKMIFAATLAAFAAPTLAAGPQAVPAILWHDARPAAAAAMPVQYYTPPPPYAYRRYYAYQNNTAPSHRTATRRSYHRVRRYRR